MDPNAILGLTTTGSAAAAWLLGKLLGPSVEAIGEGIAAPLVAWKEKRVKNATEILNNAAALVANPQTVPGRILWPILEKGSLEDDDDLRKTWARLLANAADPNLAAGILPAFVQILGELSSLEVKALEWIAEHGDADTGIYKLIPDDAMKDLGIDHRLMSLIIQDLERLNLISRPMGLIPSLGAGQVDTGAYWGVMYITDLGAAFVNACTRNEHK